MPNDRSDYLKGISGCDTYYKKLNSLHVLREGLRAGTLLKLSNKMLNINLEEKKLEGKEFSAKNCTIPQKLFLATAPEKMSFHLIGKGTNGYLRMRTESNYPQPDLAGYRVVVESSDHVVLWDKPLSDIKKVETIQFPRHSFESFTFSIVPAVKGDRVSPLTFIFYCAYLADK